MFKLISLYFSLLLYFTKLESFFDVMCSCWRKL